MCLWLLRQTSVNSRLNSLHVNFLPWWREHSSPVLKILVSWRLQCCVYLINVVGIKCIPWKHSVSLSVFKFFDSSLLVHLLLVFQLISFILIWLSFLFTMFDVILSSLVTKHSCTLWTFNGWVHCRSQLYVSMVHLLLLLDLFNFLSFQDFFEIYLLIFNIFLHASH